MTCEEHDYGSVCSGIEAASVAWEPLGMKPAWFSEVDKAACAVLARRFPSVENLGDMTLIPDLVDIGLASAPAVLVGGTPCQAFSMAGRREGLADARGQLTLTYVEIADAIDRQRIAGGKQPVICVWENVPGVLSQSDNAFGCLLGALAGDETPVEPGERPDEGKSNRYWTWKKPKGEKAKRHCVKWPVAGVVAGPERAVGWIVRDAQYYGLAQRRRRVFVIASAREGFDPAAILLELDRVRRDSPPSREAGEGVTHETAPCLTGSGRGVERTGDPRGQDPDDGVLPSEGHRTLKHVDLHTARMTAFGQYETDDTASTVKARDFKDATDLAFGRMRDESMDRGIGVRRLMPVECERLQGFPDNWTRIPVRQYAQRKVTKTRPEHLWEPDPDGNGWWLMSADGPRYKQLGNSMAVPVMRWIGARILWWLWFGPIDKELGL